jgi:hypothetical protein
MSHSYDSTLLQRMGFRDEDRKTPAHDRACIAIATDPIAFLALLGFPESKSPRVLLEHPLQKGEGKYASTVGFIDALTEWHVERPDFKCTKPHPERVFSRCSACTDSVYHEPRVALVEVKTKIVSIGDLLRQMNLYREYKAQHLIGGYRRIDVNPFVVWSLDPEDAAFGPLLQSQGYQLIVGPSLAEARRA